MRALLWHNRDTSKQIGKGGSTVAHLDPATVGQASPPAGCGGFQPRVGVCLFHPSRNFGQDAR
jgi:hypothetical protein